MPGSQHSAVEEVCSLQLKPLDFVALIPFDSIHLFLPGLPLAGPSQHHFSPGLRQHCFLSMFPCSHISPHPNCLPESKEEIF